MRKLVVAPLLALVLGLPAAAPALASHANSDRAAGSQGRAGHHSDETGPGHSGDRHGEAPGRLFVDSGIVTSVDPTASSFTFSVRHGINPRLHGMNVTVSVASGTVIRRDHALAQLSDVVAGDRVVVEGRWTPTSFAAVRVQDRSAHSGDTPDPTPPPTSGPAPTPTASPTPSATPSATTTSAIS